MISRREMFGALAVVGVSALASAHPVLAQTLTPLPSSSRARLLGVLMGGLLESDREAAERRDGLEQGLRGLGWENGRTLRLDYRWGGDDDPERITRLAIELVASRPDVILANTRPGLLALRRATSTIPIVFVLVNNPLQDGLIESLAHPGGNITGFAGSDFLMAGKWLETLMEIAPGVARVALIGLPGTSDYNQFWKLFETRARVHALEPIAATIHDARDLTNTMAAIGGERGGGLIILPESFTLNHRALIVQLAERYHLPAVYPYRYFVASGGLISYGIVVRDVFERSASYIDRILRGEKPADLPVRQADKFETAINLRTARALELAVPPALLNHADPLVE
jgi:putative ABC transport system substrate-binding protein